jgi:hypothetical protein
MEERAGTSLHTYAVWREARLAHRSTICGIFMAIKGARILQKELRVGQA